MNRSTLAWLVLLLGSFAGNLAIAEKVQIRVKDAETGQVVPARAYLKCGDREFFPAGASVYRKGPEQHFLLAGSGTIDLPASSCDLQVVRGLEYEPARLSFVAKEGLSLEVPVRRWAAMNAGWFTADMHVHRVPKQLGLILQAEDLNFAPTITYRVWGETAFQRFPNSPDFPVVVDSSHFFTANSEEVERIQGGPGVVALMARQLPIPFEGDEFYPPAAYFTREIHRRGGHVGGDKPIWLDTYVNVALGELDFIELNCNHFLPHDVDTDLIAWSHWPVEMGYRGDRGFALWMMDSYYRILNCGLSLPLSAGSASGVKATPVGYNRVYVYLGNESFTYDDFMRALKDGRSFSTNGPLIDFKIDGQVAPGSRTALERGMRVSLEASVRAREELDQVDLIVNGKVWRSYDAKGKKELRVSEKLEPDVSCWVALRAFGRSSQTQVFAHTSPAYLILDGQPVRSPADARVLLARMDQLIRYTETKAGFRRPEDRAATLALYREARLVYERLAAGK
jgi:hypothetical protein